MNKDSQLGIIITISTVGLVLFFGIPFSEPKILGTNHSSINIAEIKIIELIKPDPIMQSSISSIEIPFTPSSEMQLVSTSGNICSDQPEIIVTLQFPLMPTHESVGFGHITEPIKTRLTYYTADGWFCQPFAVTKVITKLYKNETYYLSVIAIPSKITHLKFTQLNTDVKDFGDLT